VSETFGERLRSLRLRRHLTPGELAKAVGVTEGSIRQMEYGQTKNPGFLVGLKLAHALDVTPWFLAYGRNAPQETESPAAGRERYAPLPAFERALLQINAIDRRVKSLEAWRRGGRRRKGQE
jgi:transcriptional regulator with XRE-family HTH domain